MPMTTSTTSTTMAGALLARLPFSPHVRPLHAATYLLAVALFSISFLVFLNASVSFVLTDLLHTPPPIGDIVGTLGFADELVAIVAAPVWGALSDGPLGTRGVATAGFATIAAALVVFVNVPSVYPGLLLARMFFSVGAAAVATMVSAILPEMTAAPPPEAPASSPAPLLSAPRRAATPPPSEMPLPLPVADVEVAAAAAAAPSHPTGRLAGMVGLFTGLGALLALGAFLPLPTHFAGSGREQAVRKAFYSVALVALAVGVWCLLGLPAPPAHHQQQPPVTFRAKQWLWTRVWGGDPAALAPPASPRGGSGGKARGRNGGSGSSGGGGIASLKAAVAAGRHDSRIALAYLGGFVARATSVGISLFVPLFVNHYFISSGKCRAGDDDSGDPRRGCREAYVLAAALTGVSQLSALLFAPVFGYWADRPPFGAHRNAPLVVSGLLGVVGFGGFAVVRVAEMRWHVAGCVVLMGIAQIGGIVGSLGVLGRGIVEEEEELREEEEEEAYVYDEDARIIGEEEPLLRRRDSGGSGAVATVGERGRGGGGGRRDVKGGIAGVYSLCGGAGILALTKLGGWGFDTVSVGWPFWMLAAFEGMLVVGAVAEGVWGRS